MLKRVSCIPVVLLFLPAPTLFGGPNKVPARLTQARYVALAYDLGDVLLSEAEAVSKPGRVLPEDREALNSVRDLIEKWGRYVITIRPAQAELLIAVRTGRRASAEARSGRFGGICGRPRPESIRRVLPEGALLTQPSRNAQSTL